MSLSMETRTGREPGEAASAGGKGLTALSAYVLMSIATLSWAGNIVATKIVLEDFPPQVS